MSTTLLMFSLALADLTPRDVVLTRTRGVNRHYVEAEQVSVGPDGFAEFRLVTARDGAGDGEAYQTHYRAVRDLASERAWGYLHVLALSSLAPPPRPDPSPRAADRVTLRVGPSAWLRGYVAYGPASPAVRELSAAANACMPGTGR